jgi:hypothetical protein
MDGKMVGGHGGGDGDDGRTRRVAGARVGRQRDELIVW